MTAAVIPGWARRDLNPRPLPCKGSALYRLSYTPVRVGLYGTSESIEWVYMAQALIVVQTLV